MIGIPNIPISYGTRFDENFPKMDENNEGNITETIVKNVKIIVVIPTRLEIFDME
jgi:hypothetical protein